MWKRCIARWYHFCLSSCSHAGLVDECMCLYASMPRDNMTPAKLEHYTCTWLTFLSVLAIYRRQRIWWWQCLVKPQVAAWRALLSAWRINGNVQIAKHTAKQILEMEPENAGGYVLLQTSKLLIATCMSVRVLNSRERKKVQRNSRVAPLLKWIMRCICLQ